MHFDINIYNQNKKKWLDTLSFWEKLIESPNMHPIHNISPIKNLNVTQILKSLSEKYPDLYILSDRLVCDIFDDTALINGWDIRNLPQYWTIVRRLYELKSKARNNQSI